MYLPIQFCSQEESVIPTSDKEKALFASRLYNAFYHQFLNTDKIYYNMVNAYFYTFRSRGEKYKKAATVINNNIEMAQSAIHALPNDLSWYIHLWMCKTVRGKWMPGKQVFKIESNLLNSLCSMGTPKHIHRDLFDRIPCLDFYIDFGSERPAGEYIEGMFINIKEIDGVCYILMTCIVHSDYIVPIFCCGEYSVDELSGELELIQWCYRDVVKVDINKTTSIFLRKNATDLLFNFLLYLTATNRDVVYVEKKMQRGKKSSSKIDTVKSGNVGYRIASEYAKNSTRVRYVYDKDSNPTVTDKRPLSSHYRNAHWHHYWKKNEDGEKELTLKWVQQMYIKGNKGPELDIAKVHNVK